MLSRSRVEANRFCIGSRYSNGESDDEDDDYSRHNGKHVQEVGADKGKTTPNSGSRTRPQFGPQIVQQGGRVQSSPSSDGIKEAAPLVDKGVIPNGALTQGFNGENQHSRGTAKETPTTPGSGGSSSGRPRFGNLPPGEKVTNTPQSNGAKVEATLGKPEVSPSRSQGTNGENQHNDSPANEPSTTGSGGSSGSAHGRPRFGNHPPAEKVTMTPQSNGAKETPPGNKEISPNRPQGGNDDRRNSAVRETTTLKNDPVSNAFGPPADSVAPFPQPPQNSSVFKGVLVDKIQEFRPRPVTTPNGTGDAAYHVDAPPTDHGSTFFRRYVAVVADGIAKQMPATEGTDGSVEEKRPPSQISRSGSVQPGARRQRENIWPLNVSYKRFADEIPFRREYTTGEVLTVYAQHTADPQCVFVVDDDNEEYDQQMVELIVRIEKEAAAEGSNMLFFRQIPPEGAAVCVYADVPEFDGKVWLRGQVISAARGGHHVQVFFIDMGLVSVVPLSAVRSIPEDFMKIPKWILPVQLSGREFNGDYQVQKDIIEKTRLLVVGKGHEKPIQLLIEQKLGDCFIGSLYLGSKGDQLDNILDVYRKNGIKF